MGKSASETTHELKKYSEQQGGPGTMEDGITRKEKNAYNHGMTDTIIIEALVALAAVCIDFAYPHIKKAFLDLKEKIVKPKDGTELSVSGTEEPPAPE